jgi:FkbH-like protein
MNLLDSLEYPLDIETILRKKKAIKKQLLERSDFIKKKIAVLGGSTTAEIVNILDLFLLKNGIHAEFYQSEYNRFYEDAVFGNDALNGFRPDLIYVHTTQVNLLEQPGFNDANRTADELLQNEITRFEAIWQALSKYGCAIIQNNFDLPMHRVLGNLDCYHEHGRTYLINRLNLAFANFAIHQPNLYINDINYLSSWIGLKNWFDNVLWYTAKYALSFQAIPHMAHNLSNIINAIFGQSKKCLVVDLDNTCWGGVIAEDGLQGISMGTDTALGEAYTDFQRYIKQLKQRGVILSVCSKNDEQIAQQGFNHPDMVLSVKDFTLFKANWEPKHCNIKEIANTINIATSSMVFVDDNPVERELVAGQIPEVAVPNVGDDISCYIEFVDRSGYYEPVVLSDEDKQRHVYYDENKKRAKSQQAFADYQAFLLSLLMSAEIKKFNRQYLHRITQLINKTNQFNLTTQRYTLAEIEKLTADKKQIKFYGRLADKYGDNGLIAVMIAAIKDDQCHINLWLMSCRVLKRDMELAMFDSLVRYCSAVGLTEIVGYYYKSKKNHMVADLYQQLGFSQIDRQDEDTVWKLQIKDYKQLNTTIKVIND